MFNIIVIGGFILNVNDYLYIRNFLDAFKVLTKKY